MQIEVFTGKTVIDVKASMKQKVRELAQVLGGSSERWDKRGTIPAPPKCLKSTLDKIVEEEEVNFKHKPDVTAEVTASVSNEGFVEGADRVQGLSGNNLNLSEDDMLSEEGQWSQINKQFVGLVKCSNVDLHKNPVVGYDISDKDAEVSVPTPVAKITIAEMLETGRLLNAMAKEGLDVGAS
jgi:hypothetical protein